MHSRRETITEAKIREFYHTKFFEEDDIFGFEITVNNVQFVTISNGCDDLTEITLGHFFVQSAPLFGDVVVQITPVTEFQNQVQLSRKQTKRSAWNVKQATPQSKKETTESQHDNHIQNCRNECTLRSNQTQEIETTKQTKRSAWNVKQATPQSKKETTESQHDNHIQNCRNECTLRSNQTQEIETT
ncbi:hypothetical protein T265_05205 [Opisthorchis viverrini]|uniref:Uncharacterized protein n=1 Tax=Opisthorchis viverrini TaxID=6198 RepID=A0A074ZPW0_OPIVI|nr:hypothetical protein T265_05205 [Opisthorchis viverrini]KER27852.1 hypothetical protein T265_05205 [Opisthorchis viverrini]